MGEGGRNKRPALTLFSRLVRLPVLRRSPLVMPPARGNPRTASSVTRSHLVVLSVVAVVLGVGLAGCTTINTRLAMNQGVNLFRAKEYDKAVTAFKHAIEIDPNYSDAHLDLGLTYMELYEPGSEHPKDKEYAEGAIQA